MRKHLLLIQIIVLIKSTGISALFNFDGHELAEEWSTYKETFNKNYSIVTESLRRSVWEENFFKVKKHNQEAAMGLHNYTLKANHLADLDITEYVKQMIKLLKSLRKPDDETMLEAPHYDLSKIPEELDWRDKGYNTPIRNQEDCGSCYAFSVASMIEAQVFKETGETKILSPQQLVDCSKSAGNMGCRGGSLRNTLHYIDKEGLVDNSAYPYLAKESNCHHKKTDKSVHIRSWTILQSRDELALKTAVAFVGPVAVSINASPSTFQLYHDGIYDDPACTSDKVNHAMLLIGYTKTAWILKNWWSEAWGKQGYMYLRRDRNQCGVANFAAYAKL